MSEKKLSGTVRGQRAKYIRYDDPVTIDKKVLDEILEALVDCEEKEVNDEFVWAMQKYKMRKKGNV